MIDLEITDPERFGATTGKVSTRSFTVSKFTCRIPKGAFDQEAPFKWNDQYRVTRDGVTELIGLVTKCKPVDEGNSSYWDVEISDHWVWLEKTIAMSVFEGIATSRFFTIDRINEQNPTQPVPLSLPVSDIIRALLDDAVSINLLPNGYRVDLSPPTLVSDWMMVPFSASGDSYAGLLQQCLDWQPGMISYFDYNDGGRLVITNKAVERVVVLDPQVDNLDAIDIEARNDLVPPVVGIIGIGYNGYGGRSIGQYPPDVSLKTPYALAATVDIPMVAEDDDEDDSDIPTPVQSLRFDVAPRQRVRGKEIEVDNADDMKAWWQNKFPLLSPDFGADIRVGKSRILPSTPDGEIAKTPGYDSEAKYELVSGMINGKTKTIRWGEIIVESSIICRNPPEELKAYFPMKYNDDPGSDDWLGLLRCRVRTTNYKNKAYLEAPEGYEYPDGDDEDESDIPTPVPEPLPRVPYEDISKSVYEALQRLPFQGSLDILDEYPRAALTGAGLSIINDRPERADMRTAIQVIDYDIMSGRTSLQVGPPEHIALQDIVNRTQRLQAQQDRSREDTADNSNRGDRPSGQYWTYDNDGKRTDSPTIGPWYALCPTAGQQPLNGDFSVRVAYDDDGKATGSEVHRGEVRGPKNKLVAGAVEWTKNMPFNGDIYCNVSVDDKGMVTAAEFSTIPGPEKEAKPFADGKLGKTGELYNPSENADPNEGGLDGESGSYAYHIATISNGRITQHHLGPIVLPILPLYVVFQVDDFDFEESVIWDPGFESNVGPPTSLIHEKSKRYALFKKLQSGPGIKLIGPMDGEHSTLPGLIKIAAETYKCENLASEVPGPDSEVPFNIYDRTDVNDETPIPYPDEWLFKFRSIKADRTKIVDIPQTQIRPISLKVDLRYDENEGVIYIGLRDVYDESPNTPPP